MYMYMYYVLHVPTNVHSIISLSLVPWKALDQLGVVVRVMPSGDVRLATCGKKWTMNPLCLIPVPNEPQPLIVEGK